MPDSPLATPTRRTFLHTAAGAFWSGLMAVQASGSPLPGKARAVILIFNCGAPSHLDLLDPKPDAPAEVRGPFRVIDTSQPGMRFTELVPRMARQAHRLTLLRTVHHKHTQHNSGMHWSTVGRPYRIDNTLINPSRADLPAFGPLVGWLARRDGYSGAVPPYVITPAPHCDSTAYITPGQFGGCLGAAHDPFVLNADPNSPNFRVRGFGLPDDVPPARLTTRKSLLGQLEDARSPAERDFPDNRSRALALVQSATVQRAFDLSREDPRLRERYGRHSWGQSHLLARRLIEAGAKFVTTVNGPSITWDTHNDNFNRLKNRLVPPMDQAWSALLDDLADRGMLDSTLVVWMGDFGRTPKINAQAGRDHWPDCYTMALAGGGVRGGLVIGESDRLGAYPKSQPIAPADVHATVFTALGYDPHGTFYQSPDGRPFPLSEGQVIRGVLG